MDLVIEPYVEDWLDKVERTIDPERRIAILEEARHMAPQDNKIRERLIQRVPVPQEMASGRETA